MKESTKKILAGAGKIGLIGLKIGSMLAVRAITGNEQSTVSRGQAAQNCSKLFSEAQDLFFEAGELRKEQR